MIEVQVPKDITGFEATFLGPLTARQTLFTALAGVTEYIYYQTVQYLNLGLDMNTMMYIGVIIAFPFLYLAMGKPYGMKPEVYVYNYLLPSFIGSKDRPYKTILTYDEMLRLIDEKEKAEEAAKNKGKSAKSNSKNKDKNKNKHKRKKSNSRQDKMYA